VVAVVAEVAVVAVVALPQKLPTKHEVAQMTDPRRFPVAQSVETLTLFKLASEPDTITFFQLGINS
jgi:hypothetical protein